MKIKLFLVAIILIGIILNVNDQALIYSKFKYTLITNQDKNLFVKISLEYTVLNEAIIEVCIQNISQKSIYLVSDLHITKDSLLKNQFLKITNFDNNCTDCKLNLLKIKKNSIVILPAKYCLNNLKFSADNEAKVECKLYYTDSLKNYHLKNLKFRKGFYNGLTHCNDYIISSGLITISNL